MKRLALLLVLGACASSVHTGTTYRPLSVDNHRLETVTILVHGQRVGTIGPTSAAVLMVRDPLLVQCTDVTVRTPMREDWNTSFCSGQIIVGTNLSASFVVPSP